MPSISLTPDSKFLLTGNIEGSVLVYEVEGGEKIATYSGHHKPCKLVKFAPFHVMFVSIAESVIFWAPKMFENMF